MEVQVEYDYAAEERDELALKQGDIITNVSQFEEGWYIGTFNGKEGVFPDNFVRVIKQAPTTMKQTEPPEKTRVQRNYQPTERTASSSPLRATAEIVKKVTEHPKLQAQPGSLRDPQTNRSQEFVKVVYQYTPEQSDELELVVNDFLQVVSRDLPEEGWWRGLNMRTNKTGVFPDNFVKMADTNDPEFKRVLSDFQLTKATSPTRVSSSYRQTVGATTPGSSKHVDYTPSKAESKNQIDSSPGDRGRINNVSVRRVSGRPAATQPVISNSRASDKGPVRIDSSRTGGATRNETITSPKNAATKPEGESSPNTTSKTATNRPRGTSLTRLDGSARNFGDMQQLVQNQQERLQVFASQLENVKQGFEGLRRDQREHADDVASQLRELSKQLTSVKGSQMTTQTAVANHQKLVTDRLQSLMLELDEVKKSRSDDNIALNRIKKIVLDLDSRALTSNLLTTGAGEDYHGRMTDFVETNGNASSGDPYAQPRTKLPPNGTGYATR